MSEPKSTSFVPALLELRHAKVDVVIEQLGKLLEIAASLDASGAIAGMETVRAVLQTTDIADDDIAVGALIATLQARMTMLEGNDSRLWPAFAQAMGRNRFISNNEASKRLTIAELRRS